MRTLSAWIIAGLIVCYFLNYNVINVTELSRAIGDMRIYVSEILSDVKEGQ